MVPDCQSLVSMLDRTAGLGEWEAMDTDCWLLFGVHWLCVRLNTIAETMILCDMASLRCCDWGCWIPLDCAWYDVHVVGSLVF